MKKISKISDTEWEVMKVLWESSPCTGNRVHDILKDRTAWKINTVKTLLSRLVVKGAISFREENKTYSYFPLVTEKECMNAENRSFLNKVYNGAFKTMLTNFIEDSKLSDEEIEELERILLKKKNQKG